MADEYKPLTPEQYTEARKHFSPEKIIEFEQKRKGGNTGALPSFAPSPKGPTTLAKGKSSLPNDLPRKVGNFALKSLPVIGGAVGSVLAPEGFLPAIGGAMLGGMGGSAAEQGVRSATGMDAAKSPSEFAGRVAKEGLEQGAGELVGRTGGKILEKTLGRYLTPSRLYQSGLKPGGSTQSQAFKHVETGLREGIELTPGASKIANARWTRLNHDIEQQILQAPADIPPAQWVPNIQSRLDHLRSRWGKVAGKGQQYIDQIDQFEKNILVANGNIKPIQTTVQQQVPSKIIGPNGKPVMTTVNQTITIQPKDMDLAALRAMAQHLPAQDAQSIKKATYEAIRSQASTAFDPGVHPGLQTRMMKDTASALRQELQDIYPQLKSLNAREGSLIALEKELERFAKREANKQMTSWRLPTVGAMVGGGLGAAAGEGTGHVMSGASLGATAGEVAGIWLRKVLEDPSVKSRIAIAITRAQSKPGYRFATKLAPHALPTGIRTGELASRGVESTQDNK